MWKSLNWAVISSEKNWRFSPQLRDFYMVLPQVALLIYLTMQSYKFYPNLYLT